MPETPETLPELLMALDVPYWFSLLAVGGGAVAGIALGIMLTIHPNLHAPWGDPAGRLAWTIRRFHAGCALGFGLGCAVAVLDISLGWTPKIAPLIIVSPTLFCGAGVCWWGVCRCLWGGR